MTVAPAAVEKMAEKEKADSKLLGKNDVTAAVQ
jgi:hypothetical protein